MTLAIAARCAKTGMFGVAISSSSPAVAARCPYARAGVGAVSTQNITDPTLGPRALDLMELGASAEEAMAVLRRADKIDYRQVIIVDAAGRTAAFSGKGTLGTNGVAHGKDAVAAGNLLASPKVPQSMVDAFAASEGAHLAERLLRGLEAGITAGGEAGPVHSAGLLVVDQVPWPVANLRVDWAEHDPVAELRKVWKIYEPQLADYVRRALDPASAPSFGVPGDQR
jgi:uncharacterized Ntn-hydrolase superfamily protein